jgi:glutathione S-transferase
MMENMNTPRNRAEFERNLHLLERQLKDGKYLVAQGLSRSLDGLARVRFLPNGRIDFLSVDQSARLQANMMNQRPPEAPTSATDGEPPRLDSGKGPS